MGQRIKDVLSARVKQSAVPHLQDVSWHSVAVVAGAVVALVGAGLAFLINMPGKSVSGTLAPLTSLEREFAPRLRRHVEKLAGDIGGRSLEHPGSLERTVEYIESELRSYGYQPARQSFNAYGNEFHNVEARGSGGTVVVGAHYDTAGGLPGANDNGSGVAATLELARVLKSEDASRNLRFVFFANEEPPYFQSGAMGSYVYAKRCREKDERIRAMLSLETIGYYTDEPGSQAYPINFHPGYPNTGNFLGFVSDVKSGMLLRRVMRSFRAASSLPSEGAAAPGAVPGVGWSDHWSFWQFGYRAVMVTDTAPYRYPHYHTSRDTPDKLDYDKMARAVAGLRSVVLDLAK